MFFKGFAESPLEFSEWPPLNLNEYLEDFDIKIGSSPRKFGVFQVLGNTLSNLAYSKELRSGTVLFKRLKKKSKYLGKILSIICEYSSAPLFQ